MNLVLSPNWVSYYEESLPSIEQRKRIEELKGKKLKQHIDNFMKRKRRSEFNTSVNLILKSNLKYEEPKFLLPPDYLSVAKVF